MIELAAYVGVATALVWLMHRIDRRSRRRRPTFWERDIRQRQIQREVDESRRIGFRR